MPREHGIIPSDALERCISIINRSMANAGAPYWLCFGGLWGLIKNFGTIPDSDIDICTYYGVDHKKVAQNFASFGYGLGNTVISDTDKKALHCGFNKSGLPHICLSFWYEHQGIRYYCHDQNFEVRDGEGIPQSGYWFKGVPSYAVQEFRRVEWPGIAQQVKISVPRYPGVVLDNLYPDWAWKKQRYEIDKKHSVVPDKMVSVHKGGATSPYRIHLSSMADFGNERHIKAELEKSKREWDNKFKIKI